ncbi:MAG: hypothetical protein SH847_11790 [Roseiflexaceae bacterium]|nr:hypothetical protein [Roseiflexaceae bacterium]
MASATTIIQIMWYCWATLPIPRFLPIPNLLLQGFTLLQEA